MTDAGKQVALGIVIGRISPSWLYDLGARPFHYVDRNPFHNSSGQVQTIPVPWDPVYQREHAEMVAAVGARYAGNPAVRLVHAEHMNYPSTASDVRNWTAIGFTNERLAGAVNDQVDHWAAAFPGRALLVLVFPVGIATPQDPLAVPRAVAAHGYAIAPAGFLVGSEALAAMVPLPGTQPAAGRWQPLWENAPRTAMQMLWPVAGDESYRMNAGVPSARECILAKAVATGLAYASPYMEIYPPDLDVPSFRPIVAAAATGLAANDAMRDALLAAGAPPPFAGLSPPPGPGLPVPRGCPSLGP